MLAWVFVGAGFAFIAIDTAYPKRDHHTVIASHAAFLAHPSPESSIQGRSHAMGALASVARIRHDIHTRLLDARNRTDELFDIVRDEAMYDRPIPERHRIIFYVGHVEAFDWNLLADRAFGLKPFQRELDRLFAFGIDPVDGGLPSDTPADWPEPA